MNNEQRIKADVDAYEEACLIFAARYAHERHTGAALMVVNTILNKWESLSKNTQEQLIKEARDSATCNHDDWQRLIEMGE